MTGSVVSSEVAGGAYLHWAAPGDELAPDGVARLVNALERAPDADVAVGGAIHGATYVAAHATSDPLFDLLAGGPFVTPAAAYLVRSRIAERAWSMAPEPWGAREYFATLALRGARLVPVGGAIVRTRPSADGEDVDAAKGVFDRLRAFAAGAPTVSDAHRKLLDQPWALWRVGTAVVKASPRTRALGAMGTVVGQEIARATGARTVEGWTTYVRARVPRLERAILETRDAVESLAADGLLVAEGS